MRLLLLKIYSFFQQKTHQKNNTGREKVLTPQKPVRILKIKFRKLIPDKF